MKYHHGFRRTSLVKHRLSIRQWLCLGELSIWAGGLALALLLPRFAQAIYGSNGVVRDLVFGAGVVLGVMAAITFAAATMGMPTFGSSLLFVIALLVFALPMLAATALAVSGFVLLEVVFLPLWLVLGFSVPLLFSWLVRGREWSARLFNALAVQALAIGFFLFTAALAYWSFVYPAGR